MKKWIKAGLFAAAAAVAVTGCKNTTNSTSAETTAAESTAQSQAETKSEEELTDEASITLGNYKGLSLTAVEAGVTDEQVDEQIASLLTQYPPEVTGRPAKEGDVANIDYEGTKDGVAFTGGTATGYDLTLGSGTFIDGFEDGVVGMNVGDEKDLNLTFPEDYGNADLAGQDVVFHVTLNSLKSAEGAEADDELAKRVLDDDTATLDDLRQYVFDNLTAQADSTFFNAAGSELLAQVIDNSEIVCDPDAVDDMNNQLIQTYTSYANQYGLELDDFLSMFLGTDQDGLKESAEQLVKQQMVLDEIGKAEGLKATDEQKDRLAKMNYFDNADAMITSYGEESADQLFDMGATYFFLIDNAVPAPAETETVEETTESVGMGTESIISEKESIEAETTAAQ